MRLNVDNPQCVRTIIIRLLLLVCIAAQSTVSFAEPDIVNPSANSVLSGTKQTFIWSADDIDVERWWLYVGTSPGSSDISNSGDLGTATPTACTRQRRWMMCKRPLWLALWPVSC
jgi:hypothetical protein